jgi:hypothetical protein
MSTPEGIARRRNLRTLLPLAALFLAPVLAAFWMYYGTSWRPPARVNHGTLIEPARPLARPRLREFSNGGAATELWARRWALVYLGPGDCPAACRRALQATRQARLALGNEMGRVQRVFLATSGCCARELAQAEQAGLRVFDASTPEARALIAQFPDAGDDAVFIVDPLGNLLMRYSDTADPRGLLQDLKKLLALSHIG